MSPDKIRGRITAAKVRRDQEEECWVERESALQELQAGPPQVRELYDRQPEVVVDEEREAA